MLIAFGITDLIKKAKESACIDELTGLYNRKRLSRITLENFDLIYFDLDGLKRVNDTKGHDVGDLVLIRFSQALKQACEMDEQCFRVGGDEFVVTVKEGRGQDYMQALSSILHGEPINYSYGIQTTSRSQLDDALKSTDAEMYKMKQRHKEETS
ncbi:GGDEF domain-containing protein [Vibrio mexicanus]|uniref:GGDEF domain-containing protein n=1 Tax=Vibrio mexicanus TaxID=1004326 RepID=UPI000AB625C5